MSDVRGRSCRLTLVRQSGRTSRATAVPRRPNARPVAPEEDAAATAPAGEAGDAFDGEVDPQGLEATIAEHRTLTDGKGDADHHLNGDDRCGQDLDVQQVGEDRRGGKRRRGDEQGRAGPECGGGCPSATNDALRSMIPAGTRDTTKARPRRAAMEVNPLWETWRDSTAKRATVEAP